MRRGKGQRPPARFRRAVAVHARDYASHPGAAQYRAFSGKLFLEITETALIEGVGGPPAALAELKRMGMSIVLDVFGTGYSSLSYLDRFPIDTLKVDRAFVSQLEDPAAPAPIVTAIVGMARALAVETVAEGVETAEQTAAVAALGCRYAQGCFFARPASWCATTARSESGRPRRPHSHPRPSLSSGSARGSAPEVRARRASRDTASPFLLRSSTRTPARPPKSFTRPCGTR